MAVANSIIIKIHKEVGYVPYPSSQQIEYYWKTNGMIFDLCIIHLYITTFKI